MAELNKKLGVMNLMGAIMAAILLDDKIVLVQSKGMECWISMELARRHGR